MHGSLPAVEAWLEATTERPRPWLLVLALLLALQISPWWYATPDGTAYLSIARSLATSGAPALFGGPQLGHPPGYPLLISPTFLVAERPFLLLSIVHWILAVLLMLGIHRWASRQVPQAAFLLTGIVMVNVSLWMHYRRTLSEIAFMAVLMWTVVALNRVVSCQGHRRAAWSAVAAASTMTLLVMIREVGILLAAGFVLGLLRQAPAPRRRLAAVLLAVIVTVPASLSLAGFVWYDHHTLTQSAEPQGTHLAGFTHSAGESRLATLVEGLRLRLSEAGRLIVPGMFKAYGGYGQWIDINLAVYVPLALLAAAGWWRFIRRQGEVLMLTLPFYLAAYVWWPFDAGTRYLLPMLPALMCCLWSALEPLGRRRLTIFAVLFVTHLGVATGYWLVKDLPRVRQCEAYWAAVERVAASVGTDSRPLAITRAAPSCVHLMLAFTLDRRVVVMDSVGSTDGTLHWLVVTADTPPPAGFVVHTDSGPLVLLRESE